MSVKSRDGHRQRAKLRDFRCSLNDTMMKNGNFGDKPLLVL